MFNGLCCPEMNEAAVDLIITNPDTGLGLCFTNGKTYMELRYCPWCGAKVYKLRVNPAED